jgi:hypothetical protein
MVELILRQRARGQVGHVNNETLDHGPYDDQEEQADCYLNGAECLVPRARPSLIILTIGRCCRDCMVGTLPPLGKARCQVDAAAGPSWHFARPDSRQFRRGCGDASVPQVSEAGHATTARRILERQPGATLA